ncbi:MAG: chromate transporter [Thermotaleaceae bacterium]
MQTLSKLFFIFFRIGAFTLGGGYAMIPLIQEEIVEKNKWIEEDEFMDVIALSQTIPGALAINASTYVGYRMFGLRGALLACSATMLPSILMILLIAVFFMEFHHFPAVEAAFKGIRPAVVALILGAVLKLGKHLPKTKLNLFWIITVVLLITFFRIHPILIILASGFLGFILFRREEG